MPTFSIDEKTYRKDLTLAPGQGYSARAKGVTPSSIVIHTTNNGEPTSFDFEAKYLRGSRTVSAHFLNGKAGQIAEILPAEMMAWHAGNALSAWKNERSIGIENHISVGEHWTDVQHDSLTWLVRTLMYRYHIPADMVETHRRVALPGPNIRKHDPEAWTDQAFYVWRAALTPLGPLAPTGRYRTRGVTPVYQQQRGAGPTWGSLQGGTVVDIDCTYPEGTGHDKLGRGFVWLNTMDRL